MTAHRANPSPLAAESSALEAPVPCCLSATPSSRPRRRELLALGLLSAWPVGSHPLGNGAPNMMVTPPWQPARALPAGQAPPMMLATRANEPLERALAAPLAQHWVSEKLDGVRAWWDGLQLRSRQGHPIHTPAWFTQGWPKVAMDGELWAGRGQFEATSATVQTLQAPDAEWRTLRFWVFDLPEQPHPFDQRLIGLQTLVAQTRQPNLQAVPQWRVTGWTQLRQQLQTHVRQGAEGLMLHDGHALHVVGRSPALLKLKPLDDAEAVVVAHIAGQGKHQGRLGALQVRNAAGQTFRIGTGFSDAERANPPPIGSTITYSHQGVTRHGLPRFARYVRQRSDHPISGATTNQAN